MNLSNANRILIIRLSSLGDILLSTPLIRSIKKYNKSVAIDFLLREEYRDTLVTNPYIHELLYYRRNDNKELFEKLGENKYDLCIDLQNNLRSSKLTRLLKTPTVRFRKHSFEKFLLVNFKINKLKQLPPVPVRYAGSLSGFHLDNEGLELFIPEGTDSSLDPGNNYIGLCPGSRHFTKMWPEDYYVELGGKLTKEGYRVVLFGGKSDREICRIISGKIPSAKDLSNDNDLLATARAMKSCKLIICNDSGMLHTACAVKVPVAVFFGSTVRDFGFSPYKNKNLILENNSLTCRPCSHIGREKCPKGHFKCMLDITPDAAFNEIIRMLK